MEKAAATLCFWSLLALHAVVGTALGYECNKNSDFGLSTLVCKNLDDGDLPLKYDSKLAGNYARLEIHNSSTLTVIPANAFSDAAISFDKLLLPDLDSLAEIKSGFLGSKAASTIQKIMIVSCPMFKLFPWTDLSQTTSLRELVISNTGLSAIPSGIQWPTTVSAIDLSYNSEVEEILPFTFKTAKNLEKLMMWSSSANIVFRENALYTTSRNNATFEFYFNGEELAAEHVMFENNAFGNVDGGELWDTIAVNINEFRENTFRLMLKSKFDKLVDHFFLQKFGIIHIKDCMSDCSAAWLYKDAVMFGMNEYKKILGGLDNVPVVCDGYGPALVGPEDNQDLKAHFDKCPATPMPWPGQYCKDVPSDTDLVADPDNCHCYYQCDNQQVHGHACCLPGLAFNPKLAACDWAYNVPNCS